MSLTRFVNDTEMTSLGSLTRTIGWLVAFVAFTATACILMLSNEESWGLQLAVAVLSGLGVASGIGAVNHNTLRKTAKEYAPVAEAEARGKASGKAVLEALKVEKIEVRERPRA